MAKIYISSTFQDLQDERARAYAQLRQHRHDVLSMEDYTASTRPPLEKCLADVAAADIYVGLIAWRYGYIPDQDNPQNQSITEREYRHAVEKGKEIIILMVEAENWPLAKTDSHTGENDSGARIRAFRDHLNTAHIKGSFSSPDSLAAALSPAITAAVERLNPVSADQLDDISGLSRDQLELLASRFEIPSPHNHSDEELFEFLTKKAEQFRAHSTNIETIDDRRQGLGNLKAAAQEAASRLDFEEIENLLSHVQEAEIEVAAKTAEFRAGNALIRGKPDQAFKLFSDAADSFLSVDPLEPARRRIRMYFEILRDHGLRFSTDTFRTSIELLKPALTDELKAKDPVLWAEGMNWKGIALSDMGAAADTADSTPFLQRAIAAFEEALSIRIRQDLPIEWAATQNNIAIAYAHLGIRNKEDGVADLGKSVDAYRKSLQVRKRNTHPVDWATTQNNLGASLFELGARTLDDNGLELMHEGLDCFHKSLEIRTRQATPRLWAITQHNLAKAMMLFSDADQTNAQQHLATAQDHIKLAFEILTEDRFPVYHRMNSELADQIGNKLRAPRSP